MKKIYTIGTIMILGVGGLAAAQISKSSHQPSQVIATSKNITRSHQAKKSQAQKAKPFYSKSAYPVAVEPKLANYPKTFDELLSLGEVSFQGTVTALKSHVYQGTTTAAFTMATIQVNQVLAGDESYQGKQVNVLFSGGNIQKKILLRDIADKDFLSEQEKDGAQSDEIVTVKYSYSPLPQVGEELAIITTQEPAGANGINEDFLMPIFSGKGVFIEQNDGSYARENTEQSDKPDDTKMNAGMTKMVQSKR